MDRVCSGKHGCGFPKLLTEFPLSLKGESGRYHTCKECMGERNKRDRKVTAEDNHERSLEDRKSFDYGRLPPMWEERLPLATAIIHGQSRRKKNG